MDKQARVVGWAEVTRRIELFRTKVAGASFRVSALTLHHEYGRGEWAGVDSEGKVWLEGGDFIEFAEDGHMQAGELLLRTTRSDRAGATEYSVPGKAEQSGVAEGMHGQVPLLLYPLVRLSV